MFAPPPDQPLSVGDIIGRAFRACRRNLPFIFKVLLGPTIVATLGTVGFQWAVTQGVSPASGKPLAWALVGSIVLASLLVLLGAKWVLALRQLALVRILIGYADSYESAYDFMSRRKWELLAIYVLGVLIMGGAIIVWAVEMALTVALPPKVGLASLLLTIFGTAAGVLGMTVSVGLVMIIGFVVFSALACEEGSIGQLINRGVQLTLKDFWRSVAFSALLLLSITLVSYPLYTPVVILSVVDMFQQGALSESMPEMYRMPFHLMVASQLWESFINIALWPVVFLGYGLFYYDLRLRQEGLDMERRLSTLEKEAA